MQAGGNIVHWREERPRLTVRLQLVQGNPVRSLWENDDGGLTVVTAFGLRRVSRQGELFEEPCPPGEPADSPIGGCLIDRQDRYWLSTAERLLQFSNGSWRVVQQRPAGGAFLYEDR